MKNGNEINDALLMNIRCLLALVFVPENNLEEAIDILTESMIQCDLMNEVLAYFEHTYIR